MAIPFPTPPFPPAIPATPPPGPWPPLPVGFGGYSPKYMWTSKGATPPANILWFDNISLLYHVATGSYAPPNLSATPPTPGLLTVTSAGGSHVYDMTTGGDGTGMVPVGILLSP